MNVQTPAGPGVIVPGRLVVDEISPGPWVIVAYPDGRRQPWRIDQIQVTGC